MNGSVFIDLIHNAALLLAAALGFDAMTSRYRVRPRPTIQIVIGAALGLLGCSLIISPWTYVPGIVFDTRSVLLCISGLFFGTIPTLTAMAIIAVFRLSLAGAAAWTGVLVIFATGSLGIAWRHLRKQPLREISWTELYLFGLLVHTVMLALMFTLPVTTATQVLARISLPVMTIYPAATVLLGMLMVNRLRREHGAAAIQAGQEQTRLFFDRQIAGMAITTPDKKWLRVNDELCRMLGYSREELTTLTWAEITHHDDLQTDLARFEQLLTGNIDDYCMEKRFVRKDGSIVWTKLSVGCVRLDDGRVNYILSLLIDITEHKEAEETLSLFQVLVENSSDAIGMSTPEGKHFYQNEVFNNLFGEIGDNPVDVYVDKEVGREVFQTVIAGKRWEGEVEMFGKGGQIRQIFLRAYANHDKSGKTIGLVGIHTDISERKQAERSLREREESYRTLVNNLPGLAYRCLNDQERTMLFFSEGALRMTGYPATDFINNSVRSYASIIHPDDRALVNRTVQEGIKNRQPYEIEYRLTRADGETILVYEKGQGVFGPDDRLHWLDGVIIDITEQKMAYEEREKLQAQLTQAQKMESVGRLAGGVAHDFNNMLQTILGYCDLTMDELTPGQTLHDNMIEIRKAAKRSADLTRQLLAFARKQAVAPEVLDLNDTVTSMLKMLQRLLGENIELAWLPGHELWNIRIDPSQVDQLLANLMVNARDAISDTGTITIKTGNIRIDEVFSAKHPGMRAGEYVLMTVRDTGCGMDESTLEHIFEPFFTTKEKDKGTGLGLATVYGIIKQNDGYIDVDSRPGEGTTFKVYLPRFKAEKDSHRSDKSQDETIGGSETILMVEDDEPILRLGQRILQRLGYKVIGARSPVEALRLAEEHQGEIDLLITDVIMPGMNGRELARQLSTLRPTIKLLFISGYTADVISRHGILDDNLHFAQKPFSVNELATKVREALED